MPTSDMQKVLARLAFQAYTPKPENSILPEGWSPLSTVRGDGGFSGSVFGSGNEIVVSFRGTDLGLAAFTADFWYGNIPAARGAYSPQISEAIKLIADVQAAYPGKHITLTGQSLGGGLASVVAAFFGLEAYVFAPAPFENSARNQQVGYSDGSTVALPGVLSEYYSDYLAYQTSKGRSTSINASFQQYVDVVTGTDAAAANQMFLDREAQVTGTYIVGELAQYARTILPTVAANLTPIDIGTTNAAALDLHGMLLHAAFLGSSVLRLASAAFPNLAAALVDKNLFAESNDSNRSGCLNRLLPGQLTASGEGPLDRFAADVVRLGTNGSASLASLNYGLIAVIIEHYYDAPPTSTSPFITNINEEDVVKRMNNEVVGVLVLMAASAVAQEPTQPRYWLEQGEGYPVCQDFLANLNAFPLEEPPQMCEQKIHPTHPEFTRPLWEEMDIEANIRLIHQAESLLPRFTPIGTEPKPFEEWEPLFRERVRSGQANPRLRRTPFMLRKNEPEMFIWYEPLIDECKIDLERTGLAEDPGGHIFVLRARTGKLETINLGTLGRNDVLIYHGRYPYLTDAYPDFVAEDGILKPLHKIAIGPVLPPNAYPYPDGEVPYGAHYGVDDGRCRVSANRNPH